MKPHFAKLLTALGLLFSLSTVSYAAAETPEEPAVGPREIVVNKSPWCGCCEAWIGLLKEAGYTVIVQNSKDLDPVKTALAVPQHLQSCHTAVIDGYVVEGHVPLEDIARMLEERPAAIGIAVPGMPMGSPGMERRGRKDKYDVILFSAEGSEEIYSSHGGPALD